MVCIFLAQIESSRAEQQCLVLSAGADRHAYVLLTGYAIDRLRWVASL